MNDVTRCRQAVWLNLLRQNRQYLDMSSVELDGSQAPCKNGDEAVGHQRRKAGETSNALYLSDPQGVMPAMATPQEGQHHDLFEIRLTSFISLKGEKVAGEALGI